MAVDDRYPAWAYAGQQENTTIAVPTLPPFDAPAGPAVNATIIDLGNRFRMIVNTVEVVPPEAPPPEAPRRKT